VASALAWLNERSLNLKQLPGLRLPPPARLLFDRTLRPPLTMSWLKYRQSGFSPNSRIASPGEDGCWALGSERGTIDGSGPLQFRERR
jgi:hypothetical protein